jgi:hypothetical protein
MAGLTGIEGMFFGASSARSMGREPSPEYQKQSAGGNLALAITAIIVFAMDWGAFADATILIATLLFFIFSAGVHTWDAVANKNMSVKNIMRPVLTLLIVGVCIWPLAWGIV